MSSLQLAFLGPVRVSYGGASLLPLRSNKALALIVYLTVEAALLPEQAHSRDALFALLWPGMPERSARQNLRQTLYLVRQAIPEVATRAGTPPTSLLSSDRYAVAVTADAAYELDVARFLHLVRENTITALTAAVALYRDDFLSDFYLEDSSEYEAWASGRRAHLRRLVLDALEALATHYLEQGDADAAAACAREQLRLDDLREPGIRQLMQALALDGTRNAALQAYEEFRARLEAELGVKPSPETIAVRDTVAGGPRRDRPAETVPTRPMPPARVTAVPQPLTPFVGREEELALLERYLRDEAHRLVTVVGPGGIGKSRLALHVASRLATSFPHGSYLVPLAEVDAPDVLATAVASTLGFSLHGGATARQQVARYLQDRHLLLVLDNFEHLLGASDVVVDWLRAAPRLQVLVTSQERLRLQGEWLLPLDGLELAHPGATVQAMQSDAVQLFVHSARRADPDFELTAENAGDVIAICRLLHGIPLGIELAAAWTRFLTCAQLTSEIERSLDFLSADLRDLPARHRSLRAAFDYSWSRLERDEREVMMRLSVFSSGFTYHAAAAVAGASLPMLVSLVDQSLLVSGTAGRYEMHRHLRRFVLAMGADEPEMYDLARAKHAAYFANFLQDQEAGLRGRNLRETLEAIVVEIDNVRGAWRWAIAAARVTLLQQMIIPLLLFYEVRSWFAEADERFGEAEVMLRARGVSDADRRLLGNMLAARGWFAFRLTDYRRAHHVMHESLALLQATDDRRGQAFVLSTQALLFSLAGESELAQAAGEASLALCEAVGDPLFKAYSLHNLGTVARVRSELKEARARYEESLSLFRQMGNRYGSAFTLSNLGSVYMRLGAYPEAAQAFDESRATSEGIGYRFGLATALRNLAAARLALGHPGVAALCQRALVLAQELADRDGAGRTKMIRGERAEAHNDMGEAEAIYEDCLLIFQEVGHRGNEALANLALGRVAWRHGDLERAERHAARGLATFTVTGYRAEMALAHSLLGRIAAAQGDDELAGKHLARALAVARRTEADPVLLQVITAIAASWLPGEDPPLAAALLALVAHHSSAPYQLRKSAAAAHAALPDLPAGEHDADLDDLDEAVALLQSRLPGTGEGS